MTSVEIRKLTIKDYDAMVKLWERAGLPFKPKGRDSEEMTKKQMREFSDFFLGAFDKKRLIGVVIGSYDSRMKGWINRLAVDLEFQRQGIAQRLIEKAEEALKRHGTLVFCALIETQNNESVRLFQKMGYTLHRKILYATKRENQDV